METKILALRNWIWAAFLVVSILFCIGSVHSAEILERGMQMEWGKGTSSAEGWVTVNLNLTFNDPIVVATPEYTTTTQDNGISTWITNVTNTSFRLRTSNVNFASTDNIVFHYLVVERGAWTLPGSGIAIEAGSTFTNLVGNSGNYTGGPGVSCEVENFQASFSSTPLVMSTRGSDNNPGIWAATIQSDTDGVSDLTSSLMCIGLSRSRAGTATFTNNETLYWIAVSEGDSTINTTDFEVLWQDQDTGDSGGNWINGYDDGIPFTQSWDGTWDGSPQVIVVGQTSIGGSDGSWPILYDTGNTASIRMFVDESDDRAHTGSESGGGFAFNQSGYYLSPPRIQLPSFNTTIIQGNQSVLISVLVEDDDGNNTVERVNATIRSPNGTDTNVSLIQQRFNLTASTADLESGEEQKIAREGMAGDDWLSGWNFRKPHNITGSSWDNITNYTMKFVVHNISGTDSGNNVYIGDKAEPDFSDLRFTNASGNQTGLLDYFITENGTSNVTVYVKIDKIFNNTNNTIYMYYGNSSGEAEMDMNSVFAYYEDFENYSAINDNLYPTGWTIYSSGNTHLQTLNGDRVLAKRSNNDPSGGYIDLFRSVTNFSMTLMNQKNNTNGGAQNRYSLGNGSNQAFGYGPRITAFGGSGTHSIEERNNGASTGDIVSTTAVANSNQWYRWVFTRLGTTYNFTVYDLGGSILSSVEGTDSTYTHDFTHLFVHGGNEFLTDDIIITDYVEDEPDNGEWGLEEGINGDNEAATAYTTYANIDSTIVDNISEIRVDIEVSDYDSTGSVNNGGNTNPDLELEIATTSSGGYISFGEFNVTAAGTYSMTIRNSDVRTGWESAGIRDIRVRGLYFDYNSSSLRDEINWTRINVSFDYEVTNSNWSGVYNSTPEIGRYNLTTIYALDNTGFLVNESFAGVFFNVSDRPFVSLQAPENNSKMITNGTVEFKWYTFDDAPFVNCTLVINGVPNVSTLCATATNTSYNLTIDSAVMNWSVNVSDAANNMANSSVFYLTVIKNVSLTVTKSIRGTMTDDMYIVRNVVQNHVTNATANRALIDFVDTTYVGGSYNILYDIINLTNGQYNGNWTLWNLNVPASSVNETNYSLLGRPGHRMHNNYMVALD